MLTRYANYQEELEVYAIGSEKEKVNAYKSETKKYITSMEERDSNDFLIIRGNLYYIGIANKEAEEATRKLGIEYKPELGEEYSELWYYISNSTQEELEQQFGRKLYSKNSENSTNWAIVIEYTNDNKNEINRYGSGYYYLKAGASYQNEGNSIRVKHSYIVNPIESSIQIVENETYWDINSTLGVSQGLVLNLDPTNLKNQEWTGIEKHGDVTINEKIMDTGKKATTLYFDGEEDYLELNKTSDFSDGFTFEIFANLERLKYNNGFGGYHDLGLFCKMPTLNSTYTSSLRFGITGGNTICKFYGSSTWAGNGERLETRPAGDVAYLEGDAGYQANEDFYLTFIYRRYDEKNPQWETKADKVEYYINGKLYGYTFYGIESYNEGLKIWNQKESPFFVGVSPWEADANLYYMKGNLYTCRLYQHALSEKECLDQEGNNYENEIQLNYQKTLKYITSFNE